MKDIVDTSKVEEQFEEWRQEASRQFTRNYKQSNVNYLNDPIKLTEYNIVCIKCDNPAVRLYEINGKQGWCGCCKQEYEYIKEPPKEIEQPKQKVFCNWCGSDITNHKKYLIDNEVMCDGCHYDAKEHPWRYFTKRGK